MTRRKKQRRATPPAALRNGCTPEQAAELDALWAQLPPIDCRGDCWDSCGPIRMTEPERARIAEHGHHVPDADLTGGAYVCPALTMFHQCAVYDVRPTICRLWGLVDSMPCPFGCRPDGGLLPDARGYDILARSLEIAGQHAAAARMRTPWATPELAARSTALLKAGRKADEEAHAEHRRYVEAQAGRPGTITLYVRGRGHVSSTPPASGANSGPNR